MSDWSRPNPSSTNHAHNLDTIDDMIIEDHKTGFCGLCCCCGGSISSDHRDPSKRNCKGIFSGCYVKEESRPHWFVLFHTFTKSKIWVIFLTLFSTFLLFGPAVQNLADVGPTGDHVLFILRIVMLVFFTIDLLVRTVSEEGYFAFILCPEESEAPGSGSDSNKPRFLIGSFLFWCDLLSTLSTLYDLKYINNRHFEEILHQIAIVDGIPVSSMVTRHTIYSWRYLVNATNFVAPLGRL